MSTPEPPIDPADPLTAAHVPQHALGEPAAFPPGEQWPEATLAPTADAVAEMGNAELAGVATGLTAQVGQLAIALTAERAAREAALTAEAEARSQDRRSVVTWLRRGGGFIAFDVIVTVLGLVGGYLLYGIVDTVQKQQTQTCFLYQLIVNNYDAMGPARRNFKSGTLAYDQAYQGMYNGAIALNCVGIKHPAFPTPFGAPVPAPVPPVLSGPGLPPVLPGPTVPPTVAPTPVPTPLPTTVAPIPPRRR